MSNQLIKPRNFKDLVQTDGVKARLKEIMGDRGAQFAAALIQIVNGSNQLQKCEPNSILGASLMAASLDLTCDPNLGEAYIVPYGDKAQFQIGYRGFIQLAMRSGQYKSIGSSPVRRDEFVSYDRLTGELVLDLKPESDEPVVGYAAKFKLINGFERAEYWTVDEIEKHALRYSKAYKYAKGKPDKEASCLWCTDRDKMALKTVEKALLAHYGPKSIQMQQALKVDGGAVINAETGEVQYLDNEDKSQPSKPDFGEPASVPDSGTQGTPEPETEPKPKLKSANPKPAEAPSGGMNKVKAVKGLLEANGFTEGDLAAYLVSQQVLDRPCALDKMPDEILQLVIEDSAATFEAMQEAKA